MARWVLCWAEGARDRVVVVVTCCVLRFISWENFQKIYSAQGHVPTFTPNFRICQKERVHSVFSFLFRKRKLAVPVRRT